MKTIGIVAHSTEGGALCFITACREGIATLGDHTHSPIIVSAIPLGLSMPGCESDNYAEVGKYLPQGVQYLLRTQDADGTWFVTKRALPVNNYMNAEYPHAEAQYSSFNGACWATLALLDTLPKK